MPALTAIRLFATVIGYVVIALWLLGALDMGDFVLSFRAHP